MRVPHKRREFLANSLALGMGLTLFGILVVWGLRQSGHTKNVDVPKVVIGANDLVYYSHAATQQDARVLGQALQAIGVFRDKGSVVFLSKGRNGTQVSFVVQEGSWDLPERVAGYEEIGRRIAAPVGGFPVQVRLIDSSQTVHKEMQVGKAIIGARDEVYYFGAATRANAEALGKALRSAEYFTDQGATVELSKGNATVVSFVLAGGAWRRPEVLAAFVRLIRRTAPAVGGLPITLRLLNPNMEPETATAVK
jgi:hypothetical protein